MQELLIGIVIHEARQTLLFPLFVLEVMRRLGEATRLLHQEGEGDEQVMRWNVMHYKGARFTFIGAIGS